MSPSFVWLFHARSVIHSSGCAGLSCWNPNIPLYQEPTESSPLLRPPLLPYSSPPSSRNRWLSLWDGDPKVSHRDGGWCRMSGPKKSLEACASFREKQPSAAPSKPSRDETNEGRAELLSSVITDTNVLCAHAHTLSHSSIHLSQDKEADCSLDPSVETFLMNHQD